MWRKGKICSSLVKEVLRTSIDAKQWNLPGK